MSYETLEHPPLLGTPTLAPPRRRTIRWTAIALAVILAGQVALALHAPVVNTPFLDEALYVYMGHRMWEHILHGAFLFEDPGAYFSGAPGFYPVLAAVGDHLGGLRGARTVSLIFSLGATVGVHGLGRALFGRVAGLIGAAVFVLCGSVIYLSDFATYDSMTMCFFALATWVAVYSVRRDAFHWSLGVALLLVAAFYAKYAGGVYVPFVAALAVFASRRGQALTVLRRTAFMVLATVTVGYLIFALWGQSLRGGIVTTTSSRIVLGPTPRHALVTEIEQWVGPWLVLAVAGAVVVVATRRTWRAAGLAAVLLAASVVGPAEQVRLGESVSLGKHVAFGMVFACPLIGALFATLLAPKWLRLLGVPALAATLGYLAWTGVPTGTNFLTGWINDRAVLPVLAKVIAKSPGLPILGEDPGPERYALRTVTKPLQWGDTFYLAYDHAHGNAAYKLSIDQTSWGTIYLERRIATHPNGGRYYFSPTASGSFIYSYLTFSKTPYQLVSTVDETKRGVVVGKWLIYDRTPVLPGEGLAKARAIAAHH